MSDSIPSNLSILIADDNEMNRWLLNEQLQTWDPCICECQDGQQAWEAIQNQRFDLLLIDVNMPLLNGLQLIERCRQSITANQQTPAIAITAHAETSQQTQLISAGFTECLIKPIKLVPLQDAINRSLGKNTKMDVNVYARAILQKTEFNPKLSATLLEKLFAELPTQLDQIADNLTSNPKVAAEVTHKLHGSFCFYGFEDIRPLIATLEHQLIEHQLDAAHQQFQSLQQRCTYLLEHQQDLLSFVLNAGP